MDTTLLKKFVNPAWVVKKIYHWTKGYAKLDKNDIFLICYAKTGSTWLRIVLFNLLKGNAEETPFTFDEMNGAMVAFGNDTFLNNWPFPHSPKLVLLRQRRYNLFDNNRAVVVIRDPKDVMVSFVPYANAKKAFKFSGNLKDLVYHPAFGLEAYMKFYVPWLERADLVIKFEDLRKKPIPTFQRLLNFAGLKYSDEQIETALKASSIEKTRDAQENSQEYFKKLFKEEFTFARSGKSGEGKEVFDEELDKYYAEICEKYNFNYNLIK